MGHSTSKILPNTTKTKWDSRKWVNFGSYVVDFKLTDKIREDGIGFDL